MVQRFLAIGFQIIVVSDCAEEYDAKVSSVEWDVPT